MAGKSFAKLFETPTTQVLIFYSRDPETNCPKIFRWLNAGGMEVGVHLEWEDESDESWSSADKAFDAQTQGVAEQLVAFAQSKFTR